MNELPNVWHSSTAPWMLFLSRSSGMWLDGDVSLFSPSHLATVFALLSKRPANSTSRYPTLATCCSVPFTSFGIRSRTV